MSLQLYNFFHLNLAYSAIEEEDRLTVIERCYWPLLRLAKQRALPFGIELSGYTLETIAELEPAWVAELHELISEGPCELIGSGFAQIIGPLVPPEVTAANLRIGHQVYERLLGHRPKIALLNEQAYAAGLVPLYRDAGYEAIIMEWNNPARNHADWDPEWRYLPQLACGPADERIALIWNKSIAFQKFQRYVHGEMDLDEYLAYVCHHCTDRPRAFPLYGNDAEIFDFRPGRYMTEAPLHDDGEWARIERLFAALQDIPGVDFIRPSQVLALQDQPGAGQSLRLESAAQPTPVKKQDKYNLVRWSVTGRDDLGINTRCWQLYEALHTAPAATDADWRELCYLWSSDFRTHITDSRWQRYQERLERCARHWLKGWEPADWHKPHRMPSGVACHIERRGHFLEVQGERLQVRLNCRRGLALDAFIDRHHNALSCCGTLHHGYFDDIRWGADYYSGHLTFESPGRPKVTDLNTVEPELSQVDGGLCVTAVVPTPLGPVEKRWWIDDASGRLLLSMRLHWKEPVIGSLRLGYLTMMPDAFDASNLCYRTHNGGPAMETFALWNTDFNHGRAVSFLVSASQAIGLTGGLIELGDNRHRLRVKCNKTQASLIGLLTNHQVQGKYFTRLAFSAREMDDTSQAAPIGPLSIEFEMYMVDQK